NGSGRPRRPAARGASRGGSDLLVALRIVAALAAAGHGVAVAILAGNARRCAGRAARRARDTAGIGRIGAAHAFGRVVRHAVLALVALRAEIGGRPGLRRTGAALAVRRQVLAVVATEAVVRAVVVRTLAAA